MTTRLVISRQIHQYNNKSILQFATKLQRAFSSAPSNFGTDDWADHHVKAPPSAPSLRIPSHAAHKVCTAQDAVSLISRGDTLALVIMFLIICTSCVLHSFLIQLYIESPYPYVQCKWLCGTRIT